MTDRSIGRRYTYQNTAIVNVPASLVETNVPTKVVGTTTKIFFVEPPLYGLDMYRLPIDWSVTVRTGPLDYRTSRDHSKI